MTLNSRLIDWIEKSKLPVDILDYVEGNALSDFCPLCEFIHDNIPFTHYEDIKSEEQTDNTFICKECSTALSEHLVKSGQIEINYKENLLRMKNLELYIKDGTLPPNKYEFLHYGIKKHQCIFCEKNIIGVGWPLELPSGESLYHYGGIVDVCDDCYNWLINQNLGTSIHLNNNYDECVRCKDIYPLHYGEFNERKLLGSIKKHCCPACFKDITESNNYPISNLECDVCRSDIRYDYTWLIDNPADLFLPKRYCVDCALISHDPENEVIVKHREPGYYIFLPIKSSGYVIFKLVKEGSKRKANALDTFTDYNIRYKTYELAERASKRIYNLIQKEENKQQKLML